MLQNLLQVEIDQQACCSICDFTRSRLTSDITCRDHPPFLSSIQLKMALLYILIPFVTVMQILKMVTHVTRLKTKTAVTFEMPSHLSAPLCPVPLLGHPCRNWLFRKHRKTCRHLVSFDLQDRGFFRLANWLYCLLVVALTNV